MSWIDNLKTLTCDNKYSQYGEECIVIEIFNYIPAQKRFYVDIGAGLGISNTRRLKEEGWHGVMIDKESNPGMEKVFITPDNVVKTLDGFKVPLFFDFLSIDIDSFDLQVLENLLPAFHPNVICAEYNPAITGSKVLSYQQGYTWDGTTKYGFSWDAGVKMFKANGYTVILCHHGNTMWAVANSLIKEPFQTPHPVYKTDHPASKNAVFINY